MTKRILGLDLNGTLILTEPYYRQAEDEFFALMKELGATDAHITAAREDLIGAQRDVLTKVGYGVPVVVHAFCTLMQRYLPDAPFSSFARISEITDRLRNYPLEMYPDVEPALREIAGMGLPIVIISKGEYHHQADQIDWFRQQLRDRGIVLQEVHIVHEKDAASYQNALSAMRVSPANFMMIGDSLRSDVQPVIEIGGQAIHLTRPGSLTVLWKHERDLAKDMDAGQPVVQVESLADALPYIRAWALAPQPGRRPDPADSI